MKHPTCPQCHSCLEPPVHADNAYEKNDVWCPNRECPAIFVWKGRIIYYISGHPDRNNDFSWSDRSTWARSSERRRKCDCGNRYGRGKRFTFPTAAKPASTTTTLPTVKATTT